MQAAGVSWKLCCVCFQKVLTLSLPREVVVVPLKNICRTLPSVVGLSEAHAETKKK